MANLPSQFQRAGTIGIAAAILYGTVFRRMAQWMLGEHHAAVERLSVTINRSRDLPDLFDLTPEGSQRKTLTVNEFVEYKKALDREDERRERAKEVRQTLNIAEGLERQGLRLELPVVCLATIQTGYGDLLLTILRG